MADANSTELMVWTQPGGANIGGINGVPSLGSVTLSGITYDIHKYNNNFIIYLMRNYQTSGTVNLLEIMNNMISRGYIPSTSTLGAIDYGVEVCNTNSVNAKFEVNNFSIIDN